MTKPSERRDVHGPVQELSATELGAVSGGIAGLVGQALSNLANMRHEMLKAVAQNLRG